MKFNTAYPKEKREAMSYAMKLINGKKIVEIKRVSPNRSLRQNSYLHLLLSDFGEHFGYNLEEAKQIYKEMSKGIYAYEKTTNGVTRTFWRSSADLTVEEMTKTIERLREVSAAADYPLPPATDQEWLRSIENRIEQSNYHLR